MIRSTLGAVPVLLAYEYDQGERMTHWNPGSPSYAIVTEVHIGGLVCEPEYFDPDTVIRWEDEARRDAEGGEVQDASRD